MRFSARRPSATSGAANVWFQSGYRVNCPVNVFTDRSVVPRSGNIHWLMRPLLNPQLKNSNVSNCEGDSADREVQKALAQYNRTAHSLFRLTDLEHCDVAVVPMDWTHIRGGHSWHATPDKGILLRVMEFARVASIANKPIVVFFCGERSHEPIAIDDAFVFRCSMYRSSKTERDFSIPQVLLPDIRSEFKDRKFSPRVKAAHPTVGFCGFARRVTSTERLKTVAYKLYTKATLGFADVSQYKGLELRYKCIKVLQGSHQVKSNFLLRSNSVYLGKNLNDRSIARTRSEFVDTLIGNDYQLCVRGSANYSHRLWETLCTGRIPIFLDSDCVLPFEQHINWPDFLLNCDVRDLDKLPDLIVDFHDSCSDEDFMSRQRRCREVWEKVATPCGIAVLIQDRLREIASNA